MRIRMIIGGLAVLAVSAVGASAQRAEVTGDWRAQHVGSSGNVQTCDVGLTTQDWFGAYKASSFACSGELFGVDRYRIEGGEVVLVQGMSTVKARLRMRGDRLVGTDAKGREVTLTRKGAPPTVPSRGGGGGGNGGGWDDGPRGGGWDDGRGQCVRHGDSDRCATAAEMSPPQVRVITRANLRSAASKDASVVTVLNKGTCAAVQECRQQGDQLWCRVQVEGATGYLLQISRSTNNPSQRVLVFKSGCPD